ncbi:unnamed protein product [Periconia digitata]|uniref:Uncharacterized protein n=1 Tax=Periconia digitata TaxID=1303443 RepID=A0A9W4ULP0_9PLEO|nr:unnamed protein product [Periconia digitata]
MTIKRTRTGQVNLPPQTQTQSHPRGHHLRSPLRRHISSPLRTRTFHILSYSFFIIIIIMFPSVYMCLCVCVRSPLLCFFLHLIDCLSLSLPLLPLSSLHLHWLRHTFVLLLCEILLYYFFVVVERDGAHFSHARTQTSTCGRRLFPNE